jgi:hypothetical protein
MKKFKDGREFKAKLADGEVCAVFYMTYCPFCMAFLPQFEKKFGNKQNYVAVALDSDEDPLWEECNINAVPTVLIFKGKKIAKRFDAVPGVGLKLEEIK